MNYQNNGDFHIVGMPIIPENVCREIEVLTGLLKVLSNGIVKPNDMTYQIKKLRELEEKEKIDLSEVINCCQPENTVREAREFRPLLSKVLLRLSSHFERKLD